MKTITTKQLRENMPKVISDLQKGKPLQITYRHKLIGSLQPLQSATTPRHRGSASAVQNFLKTADFGPVPKKLKSSKSSFKQEISKLRDQDLN